MLSQSSTSLSVSENSLATAIGIAAPVDTSYASAALSVKVTALPSNGTILLADGITVLSVGQSLTVTQLTGLRFRPALNGYGDSSSFTFSVSDPAGATANGTASVTIGPSTVPVVTTWTKLGVPQNSGSTPIGIQAPVDSGYAASALSVVVKGLPTNGTVYLSNGTTAVTQGETLTVAQLTGLLFKPASNSAGEISTFSYSVSDPAGHTATGSALLVATASTPPQAVSKQLTVATGSSATPIGIAAPVDANFPSLSSLAVSVTGLPTDGKVVLSDGATQVTLGESLTVTQLTGLEFVPTAGAVSQTSTFKYSVRDPSGASSSATATLNIGPANTPLVATPTSLTVDENGGPTPIGIQAPSDANYSSSQLTVKVTGLPTDGSVSLANGGAPVTIGESLSVSQLTGLLFTPTQDNTGQTSNFTYSVSDPAGKAAAGTATLTTGPNAIVLENEKPGTPQSVWQVDPGQDSTLIQGFTTAISTNVGGEVDFKVNNQTGNPNYQINIYRLGYYGGDGATLVTTIQHQAASAVVQPAALTDPATGLVDAGNWQVTDAWNVPANATSGVYVANIVEGSQVFQIPFIIKNASSSSDIVFQTDDETWEAYNGWGGANLYGGDGPSNPPNTLGGEAVPGAAYAVSYNRPIVTRDGIGQYAGPQDSVFGAEYAAIYWMEENGYDVSYIAGADTATNGSLLLNHKIFMDAGHDEYWTDSQVANVEAAENAGVNLAFLSGNEVFWQTQYAPSIDGSGTANRTLVSYKDSHFESLINPTGQGTGTFESPASWGGLNTPSNGLTGQLFSVDQTPTLGTITIPYGMTQLRIWRNTSVAATAPGQTASLESGLLGYEWDSSPDNGFMPAGLVDVSSTTLQEPTVNTEFGNDDVTGSATHNLVEYRDPTSGALVFGAGTVFWSWGLSSEHDSGPDGNTTTTDPNVQQAMVNLFADMGVQPSTLQSTLVLATASTDHTPPTSKITGVSATNVVEGASVTVTGSATDVGGVIGAVQISTDSGKTWHVTSGPVGTQSVTWTYTFHAPSPGTYSIETRAVDDSLNLETPGPGTVYTTTPSSALTIFGPSATPAVADIADTQVDVGVKFTSSENGQITGIRFYKGTANTGTHVGDLWSSTGTLLATATFTGETASGWQQVNFATPVAITAGTTYVASYQTAGGYADTSSYFDNYTGQTNGALTALGDGANGVYAYGTGAVFPNTVSGGGDNYWVDVVFNDNNQGPQPLPPVANNDGGFIVTENSALTIAASTLLANDTDPNGLALSMTGVSKPTNGTVSYNSTAQTVTFTPTTGYTGNASFVYSITDADGGTASATVSLSVNSATAQRLFSSSAVPNVITQNDPNPVELGVKFTASKSGTISGIDFYKGPSNTGTHIADLWSSTGTLLATATFTNESASGWQQVNFSTPVAITAGTTYIAAYHTSGEYSANDNYFTTPLVSGDLTAPAGSNGVYAYGSTDLFPTNTYESSNYWVDVVYNPTGSSPQPPVANNDSGFVVTENSSLSIAASALLANDTDPNGLALSMTGVSNPTNGTVSYNSSAQIVTFTPTAGYTGNASFVYSITDADGGTASATVSLSVNSTTAQRLFSSSAVPNVITENDPNPVELGVKFTASESGTISGIDFYKGPSNTGTHTADLWSSSGTLLATATFTNESASGWQQVNFSTPVAITAGTTYIAAYHTSGDYSANENYFTTPLVSGNLTAPAGSNGVYAYGSTDLFPTNTYQSSNYWVDVVYNPTGSSLQQPVANNDSGFVVNENGTVSIAASALLANDTDPNGLALSVSGVSNSSNGSASYNASTQIVTFTPSTGYTGSASFSYSVVDTGGESASASASLIVNDPTTASLFNPGSAPAVATVNDVNSVELGVKFTSSENGNITGIRFYKGALNTGTHVADLWSSTGTLLTSATFTNETASGWQQVNFATPVAITAGTTYVASYHTNGDYSVDSDYFANTLTSGVLTAPSSAAGGGNGVYAYGSGSLFPTNTYNASSYGVDVLFKPQLAT